MADSTSNTTLAVLILVALAISIVGTYLVLNKPAAAGYGISGAIVGNATFNVTAISSIKFYNNTYALVNFGNINITDCSPWFATGGTNQTPPCYNNTEEDNPNPFIIENDGGNKVNVTASATGPGFASSQSFWASRIANTSCYHAPNTAPGTCNGGNTTGGGVRAPAEAASFFTATTSSVKMGQWNNYSGSAAFSSVGMGDFPFLNFTDSNDTAVMDMAVNVGSDESAGMHNLTVTFVATSSGTGP
ncbi:MAG TPA: hypothetical protein VGQ00_02790 [Candidatus Norongarragalinales archaeon]|jgi:hypothetical protein|nr:hypothetical protein [Candidatus Norongarragalinales archaeon]